ncbi:hypothetical protein BCR36DRAFT_581596 [Piromyces finnis]|uniref:ARM repeat-containing protein n=1 Tax=Piromyces finnis TaxID=1754191 RepID=A0A1Y1VGX1_9FUNG|nr:hypothetical protein BCR36DRAFT_581596 [Piromyces finnis]|eukprot:ORX54710.1 hypothetical protein BCR36DRAFT_581596 [Piromyces finnis]
MSLKETIDNAYNLADYEAFGDVIAKAKNEDPDQLIESGIMKLIINYLEKFDNIPKDEFEKYWLQCIKCFELIAEMAKTESTRVPIGESGVVNNIAKVHKGYNKACYGNEAVFKLSSSTYIQILRAYANICFDNEKNRDLIFEAHAIDKIVPFLQQTDDLKLVQIACGALCNISMDNEPIQNEICVNGGVSFLRSLILLSRDSDNETYKDIAHASLRVVLNLVETECGLQNFISSGILQLMITLTKQYMYEMKNKINVSQNLQTIEIIVNILDTVVENENVQRVILEEDLLEPLLLLIEFIPDKEIFDDDEDETSFHDLKKSTCKSVISVTTNDVCMNSMLNESNQYKRFINWMVDNLDDNSPEREEIRSTGAYCLGNLARSDESCIKLVQDYKVMEPIMNLLRSKVSLFSNGGQPSREAMKVLHALVGTLKNLCLAAENRQTIGETGLIELISSLLTNIFAQPIHYLCVGIIKNLCRLCENNAVRFMTGKAPIENSVVNKIDNPETIPYTYLLNLIARSTSENDTHVRNEGARVIVNLVKSLWKKKEMFLLSYIINNSGVSCLLSLILGIPILKSKDEINENENDEAEDSHGVRFDQVPTAPQIFPILQNEGILALILLLNVHEEETMQLIKKNENLLVPQILEIIKLPSTKRRGSGSAINLKSSSDKDASRSSLASLNTSSVPNELKNNSCILLNHLCNDADIKNKFKNDILVTLDALDEDIAGSSSNIDFVEDENTTYAGIKPDILHDLVSQLKNKIA